MNCPIEKTNVLNALRSKSKFDFWTKAYDWQLIKITKHINIMSFQEKLQKQKSILDNVLK